MLVSGLNKGKPCGFWSFFAILIFVSAFFASLKRFVGLFGVGISGRDGEKFVLKYLLTDLKFAISFQYHLILFKLDSTAQEKKVYLRS